MAISSNIKNNYWITPTIRLSMKDYTDFFLHPGNGYNDLINLQGQNYITDCLLVSFPFTTTGNTLISEYSWEDAVFPTGTTIELHDIGLTGLDNGYLFFDKSVSDCNDFYNVFTGSTLTIDKNYKYLHIHPVSGYTKENLHYIITTGITTSGTTYNNFLGGFYQGFFKLKGYDYQILPLRPETEFSFEFYLKPSTGTTLDYTTINDIHPNNKGIFFYLGTRAENKFYDINSDHTTVKLTTGSTFFCDCDYQELKTSSGLDLLKHSYYLETDNKFLFFDGSENGLTINDVTILESTIINDNEIILCYSDGTRKICVTNGGNLSNITLQDAYNNSTTPQIITSTSLKALTIRRGSESDNDSVIEIQNGDGLTTSYINGDGTASFTSTIIGGQISFGNITNDLSYGTNEVVSFDKNSGTVAYIDYLITSQTNTAIRGGVVTTAWDKTLNQIIFNEVSTGDLMNSTSDVSLSTIINGDNITLQAIITDLNTWTIKTNIRII